MHDYTIWRVVDSHWVNIFRDCTLNGVKIITPVQDMLSMYLWNHGFEIPFSIKYCLSENDKYTLIFHVHGGSIHVHIFDNN